MSSEFTEKATCFKTGIKIKSLKLSESTGFRMKYKALQRDGTALLLLRYYSVNPASSESVIHPYRCNVLRVTSCVDGLIFKKYKTLDKHTDDVLELSSLSDVSFSSYSELYDVIRETVKILSCKEFDGETI